MPIVLMPVDAKLRAKFFMGAKMSTELESSNLAGNDEGVPSPRFGCS